MEKVKQLWDLVKSHKKISIAVAVVIVIIIITANQKFYPLQKKKTRIDSFLKLRRPKMFKKWWKKFVDWFWEDFYGRDQM